MSQVFVGREAELERAGELIEATLAGAESVYCVEGGAGIGKTALMQRIVEMCRANTIVVLNGSFVDGQDLPPLWPWRRILAKVKNVTDADQVEKHEPLFAGLESSWDDIEELSVLPATDRKFRFFEMVGSCLADLAQRCPISLVIDDLHTGDDLSLHLLLYLLDALELSPAFVLLGWRPGDGSGVGRIEKLKDRIFYLPNAHAVTLGAFGREELRGVLGAFSLDATAAEVEHLHQWTKGSPLQIRLYAERLRSVSLRHPVREATVSELVWLTTRETLSTEAVRTVKLLALVGNGFTQGEVESLVGDSSKLSTVVVELMDSGVIRRSPESDLFSFLHDELRKAVLGTIPEVERKQLLSQAVQRLEESVDEDDRHVWLLKELLFALDDRAAHARKTIEYALRAIKRSISRNAWSDALVDLERLLADWKEQMTEPELRSVQFDLLIAYDKTFQRSRAVSLFEELWRYHWARDDLERLIDLAGLSPDAVILSAIDLVAYHSMLLEKLPDDHPRRCEVLCSYGMDLLEVRGEFAHGRSVMEEAAVEAERSKSRRFLLLARFQLAFFDFIQRRFAETLEAARNLLERHRQELDTTSLMGVRLLEGAALLALGQSQDSRAVLEHGAKEAVLYENPLVWLNIVGMLQRFELRAGNWANIGLYQQRAPGALWLQLPQTVADYLTGNFAAADEFVESLFAEQRSPNAGTIQMTDPMLTWLIAIRNYLTRDGRWLRECRVRLDRTGDLHRSRARYLADYPIVAARIASAGLSPGEAKEYYEKLREAEEYFFEEEEYSAAAAKALLALRWDDRRLAMRHFEEAIAFCDKYEERPWRAHYLFELAALLPDGEQPRKDRLVEEASAEARRLGLKPLLGRIEREWTKPGIGGKTGAESGSDTEELRRDVLLGTGITHREQEVLECLVEGLTDKEIAAILNISPYTVGNHLRNIYSKTESSTRGEAVHWALVNNVARIDAVPDPHERESS